MSDYYKVPIAIFLFKRSDTVLKIIDVLRQIKPLKLYLVGDGPRNENEREQVINARQKIEQSIDWDCEVVKNYAQNNRGVYENIAGGAKWVLGREKYAIFLEDDNLPSVSFFRFCEELLEKYESEEKVLWICGTNYLEKYTPRNKSSYVFTKHIMPCGWASWRDKFSKYYDGDLTLFEDKDRIKNLRNAYDNRALYNQQITSAKYELYRRDNGLKYASWDFQMAISIRANDVYGICPCKNQIKNIGVDGLSTHGGNSFANEMTRRFCGIESFEIDFPLVHPNEITIDKEFEKQTGRIILFPFHLRVKEQIAVIIKHLFGLNRFDKFTWDNIRKKHFNNAR